MINLPVSGDDENYLTLRHSENSDYKGNTAYVYTTTSKNKVLETAYVEKYLVRNIGGIMDYVNIVNGANTTTYSLIPNLFTITIDGTAKDSSEITATSENVFIEDNIIRFNNVAFDDIALSGLILNFNPDSNTASVKVVCKIFADKNSGFPIVSVSYDSSVNNIKDGCIKFSEIALFEESENHNAITTPASISCQFFGDAFVEDPETGSLTFNKTKYETLKVSAYVAYTRASKYSEAKVSFTNSSDSSNTTKDVMITNPNGSLYENGKSYTQTQWLEEINKIYHTTTFKKHACDTHSNHLNCVKNASKCDMLDRYYLYTISNVVTYIQILELIADKLLVAKSLSIDLMTEILQFNPAAKFDEDDDKVKYDSLPKHGDIFDYLSISRSEFANILDAVNYPYLANRIRLGLDLRFTQLDVYANFKKNINKNYFGNSLSYGDALISVVKLTQHTAPHTVVEGSLTGITWDERERGYTYVNSAMGNWQISQNLDIYTTQYDNNFSRDVLNMAKQEISTGKAIVNWFSGIVNRKAKYAGTYKFVVHNGLLAESHEFVSSKQGDSINSFIAHVIIDLSPKVSDPNSDDYTGGRIKTANLDKVHSSIVAAIVTYVAGIALTVAGVLMSAIPVIGPFVGPLVAFAGVACIGIAIHDGIQIISGASPEDVTPINHAINNLDFSFN